MISTTVVAPQTTATTSASPAQGPLGNTFDTGNYVQSIFVASGLAGAETVSVLVRTQDGLPDQPATNINGTQVNLTLAAPMQTYPSGPLYVLNKTVTAGNAAVYHYGVLQNT